PCWIAIPSHSSNVATGDFAMMPNHFHGIVFIEGAGHARPLHGAPALGTIVGSFKSASTRSSAYARPRGRLWQRGFHDRVIRNEIELAAVRDYIRTNVTHHLSV